MVSPVHASLWWWLFIIIHTILSSSLLDGKLLEKGIMIICVFYFLAQCLTHCKHSINICWQCFMRNILEDLTKLFCLFEMFVYICFFFLFFFCFYFWSYFFTYIHIHTWKTINKCYWRKVPKEVVTYMGIFSGV